jgi:hypothetical protein
MKPSLPVQEFFKQIERSSDTLDLELIASLYADSFMFADPNGARVIEKQKFLAALPKRQEFFKALGHQSTKVLSLDETGLDDHYVMVHAYFVMRFEKASVPPIDAQVDSTYILHLKDDSPKIVFHLESEEVQQALQARGVLAAKPE